MIRISRASSHSVLRPKSFSRGFQTSIPSKRNTEGERYLNVCFELTMHMLVLETISGVWIGPLKNCHLQKPQEVMCR